MNYGGKQLRIGKESLYFNTNAQMYSCYCTSFRMNTDLVSDLSVFIWRWHKAVHYLYKKRAGQVTKQSINCKLKCQ